MSIDPNVLLATLSNPAVLAALGEAIAKQQAAAEPAPVANPPAPVASRFEGVAPFRDGRGQQTAAARTCAYCGVTFDTRGDAEKHNSQDCKARQEAAAAHVQHNAPNNSSRDGFVAAVNKKTVKAGDKIAAGEPSHGLGWKVENGSLWVKAPLDLDGFRTVTYTAKRGPKKDSETSFKVLATTGGYIEIPVPSPNGYGKVSFKLDVVTYEE